MERISRQAHWENVYTTKGENEVSLFQENPALSLELIEQAGATPMSAIVDGASRLVDRLIEKGFADITVLDLSGAALEAAKRRLGADAGRAQWVVADATIWEPAKQRNNTTSGTIVRRSTFSPRSRTAPPMSRGSREA